MRGNFRWLLYSFIFIFALSIEIQASVIQLTSGWEYSVQDDISDNMVWHAISSPSNVPDRGSHSIVWFRVPLSMHYIDDMVLHCANIDQCFSVYIDNKAIYTYGTKQEYLSVYGTHIIPLPIYKDPWVYLKVYSNWARLGMYADTLDVGTLSDIQRDILVHDLLYIIIAVFSIIIGICLFLAVFVKLETPEFTYLGIFSILLGLYTLGRTELKNIYFGNNYMFWGSADLVILYALPVFLFIFLCYLFKCSKKSIFKLFTEILCIYVSFILIGALIDFNWLVPIIIYNFYILASVCLIIIGFSVYYAVLGNINAKWIGVAFTVGTIFAIHDLLNEMSVIHSPIFLTPWGQVFILCTFICIAMRQAGSTKHNHIIMERDLDIARRIQMSIIPTVIPYSPHVHVAVQYHPMHAIGGDLYDFYTNDTDGFGILIADAAGHGIPAALLATMTSMAFSIHKVSGAAPAEVLTKMNLALSEKCEDYFVTALYVHIDTYRSQMTIARAGHPPLVHYQRNTNVMTSYLPKGKLLGRFENNKIENLIVSTQKGDRLFLYTDGLEDVRNDADNLFGTDLLMQLFEKTLDRAPESAANYIISSVMLWGAPKGITDDISLIIIDL